VLKTGSIYTVDSEAPLRALASTVRLDIIDTMLALGKASAPDLARQLGRPADALYYHLRALDRAGLVREVGERKRGRTVEAVYSVRSKRLALSHRPQGRGSREAVQKIVKAMLLTAQREYSAASADANCVVDGPSRELWPSRSMGWLSKRELTRVNSLLSELNVLVSARRSSPDQQLYSLQFLLAPTGRGRRAERDISRTAAAKKTKRRRRS